MKKLQVLIAEDHALTASGIKEQIKKKTFNSEIYSADNGLKALNILENHPIDLLVTDINMPKLTGIELIEKAKVINPDIDIIVVTYLEQHSVFKQISKMDVNAVILKTDNLSSFAKAIEEISDGRKYISPEILHIFSKPENINAERLGPGLTGREREVLKYLADDLSTKEIADHMHLAETTIETYRAALRTKFEVNTMQGVVSKAYKFGIL